MSALTSSLTPRRAPRRAPPPVQLFMHPRLRYNMDLSLTLRDRQNLARNAREDLLSLQKCGQDLYRKEQYEAALHCFNQVHLINFKLSQLMYVRQLRKMLRLLSMFSTIELQHIQSLAIIELRWQMEDA